MCIRDSIKEDGWQPGVTEDLPQILLHPKNISNIKQLIQNIEKKDCINSLANLFESRDGDFNYLRKYANELRGKLNGNTITYVSNRNINYTNMCIYSCSFCAFSKSTGAKSLRGKSYNISLDEIQRRVLEAISRGANEVCLQGGIHPKFDENTYIVIDNESIYVDRKEGNTLFTKRAQDNTLVASHVGGAAVNAITDAVFGKPSKFGGQRERQKNNLPSASDETVASLDRGAPSQKYVDGTNQLQ